MGGVPPPDPACLVREGYDRIGDRYEAWAAGVRRAERQHDLRRLTESLSPGSHVLDIGCATGRWTAARLSERFRVTGVDLSSWQIETARRSVRARRFTATT